MATTAPNTDTNPFVEMAKTLPGSFTGDPRITMIYDAGKAYNAVNPVAAGHIKYIKDTTLSASAPPPTSGPGTFRS